MAATTTPQTLGQLIQSKAERFADTVGELLFRPIGASATVDYWRQLKRFDPSGPDVFMPSPSHATRVAPAP